MGIVLYNTLTRSKEALRPIEAGKVGLYTCGPTVYNYQHIGNYRTYVFEDCLRRALEYLGYSVRHVMNITDVGHLTSQADEGEDKVELAAAKQGKTAWEIAEFYTQAFLEDAREFNLLPAHVLCKATGHVPDQINLIRRLEEGGLTYGISDGIYFDASRFADYGRLMGPAYREGLCSGARVEANPEKRNPVDFALWKFSPKDQKRHMEWPSPWGVGFPGWHIECSAMAMRYLGESFDIHCGGVDHIPIHHTNEIAQSEGATGRPFVKIWMHGEFLLMNNAKMAKSAGHFLGLRDLRDNGFTPLDYRYLCMTAHYRRQFDFSWEALDGAKSALRRLRERSKAALGGRQAQAADGRLEEYRERFKARIRDDLDMPGALAVLWDSLKPGVLSPGAQRTWLEEVDGVLGLGFFKTRAQEPLSPELQSLVNRREEARRSKDFAQADALRRELLEKGISVEDTPQGPRWRRGTTQE